MGEVYRFKKQHIRPSFNKTHWKEWTAYWESRKGTLFLWKVNYLVDGVGGWGRTSCGVRAHVWDVRCEEGAGKTSGERRIKEIEKINNVV